MKVACILAAIVLFGAGFPDAEEVVRRRLSVWVITAARIPSAETFTERAVSACTAGYPADPKRELLFRRLLRKWIHPGSTTETTAKAFTTRERIVSECKIAYELAEFSD